MMHVLDTERVLVVVKFVNIGADHRPEGTGSDRGSADPHEQRKLARTHSTSVKSQSGSLASMKISRGHLADLDRHREAFANMGARSLMVSPMVTTILVQRWGVPSATARQCLLTDANTSGVVEDEDIQGEISSRPRSSVHASSSWCGGSGVCAPRRKMYERSSTGRRQIGAW